MRCKLTPISMQRPRSTRRPLLGAAMVLLALALAVLAGCGGGDTKEEAAAPAEGFDSAYCKTARAWAAHEVSADEATTTSSPATFRKYWNEYLANLETQLQQAPPAVHDAAVVNTRGVRTVLTPVFEKYGFDVKRIEAEGSDSEQAGLGEPPPDVAKAQAALHLYQDRVCGFGGQPPAADVTFTESSAAKPYCAAVAVLNNGLGKVASSGFDPAAFRSYATSDSLSEALDALDATAASEIAADVKTNTEWVRTRQLKVLEEFDYDIRRLLLEGSAKDVAVFTFWDPAIIKHNTRVAAYEEQFCGA